MRKIFRFAGALAIVLVLAQIVILVQRGSMPAPRAGDESRFAGWSVGQTRTVDYANALGSVSLLSERDKRDQVLDWALYSVVSAAGLSASDVSQVLYDLPPIRRGELQVLANYDYGPIRSRLIGDGDVAVLLPAGVSDAERSDDLAHVADEHRKNTGTLPVRLLEFDYAIDSHTATLQLTRQPVVDGQQLFTPAAGYVEQTIASLQDLQAFMAQVDDVTFAQLSPSSSAPSPSVVPASVVPARAPVRLGGRKLQAEPYQGIRVEDVAALWQSEDTIVTRLRQVARGAQRPPDLVGGSGFSLDPLYDYKGLHTEFAGIEARLTADAAGGRLPVSVADVQSAQDGLAANDGRSLLRLLAALSASKDGRAGVWADVLTAMRERFAYQRARYDGALQGTEVGMVLFYTDLLAKLWALDYIDSAPTRSVPGFLPATGVDISPIYRADQEKNSSTRTWFGVQHKGFQIGANGTSLLMARNATRIYSASSNPLEPGVEVEPNAESTAFEGWWDSHFEEVARYEPQYQRLNQIMKWSLVIGWLNGQNQGARLDFLKPVPVVRSNWFPAWSRQQKDLRFSMWDRVAFYDRGSKGVNTEAMPLLESAPFRRFGTRQTLEGGVSLGSAPELSRSPKLSNLVGSLLQRSNVAYESAVARLGRLTNLDKAVFEFGAPTRGRASVVASPPPGKSLRGVGAEWSGLNVEFQFAPTAQGLQVDVVAGESSFGRLTIDPTQNGMRLGWQARELDQGQLLAMRLGGSPSPMEALARDTSVEAAIVLDKDSYLVKLHDSDHWLELRAEGPQPLELQQPHVRVADPLQDETGFAVAALSDTAIMHALGESTGYLVADVDPISGLASHVFHRGVDGPTPTARSVTLEFGSARMDVKVDILSGQIHFDRAALTRTLADDPGRVADLLDASNLEVVMAVARQAGDGVTVMVPRRVVADQAFAARLGQREVDPAAVARDIASDQTAFRANLDQHLHESLVYAQQLLRAHQDAQAAVHLDAALKLHGRVPDLLALRALADLGQPVRLEDFVAGVNEPAVGPLREPAQFYDELNWRRAQAKQTPTQVANVGSIGTVFEWRNVSPDADVKLGVRGEEFIVQYHVPDFGKSRRVAPGEALHPDAAFFLQDHPSLNNLDFPIGLRETLEDLIGRNRVTAYELTDEDAATFLPHQLFATVDGHSTMFNNVTEPSSSSIQFPRYQPQPQCDEHSEDARCRRGGRVYVIVVNS